MVEDQTYATARRRVEAIKGYPVRCRRRLLVRREPLDRNAVVGAMGVSWLGRRSSSPCHRGVGFAGWLGADWEERKIEELMSKKPRA